MPHANAEGLQIRAVTLLRHDSGLELSLVDMCCPASLTDLVSGFEDSLWDSAALMTGKMDDGALIFGGMVTPFEVWDRNLQGAAVDVRAYEVGFAYSGVESPEVVHIVLSYLADDGSAFMAGFFATDPDEVAALFEVVDLALFVFDTFRVVDPEIHQAVIESFAAYDA